MTTPINLQTEIGTADTTQVEDLKLIIEQLKNEVQSNKATTTHISIAGNSSVYDEVNHENILKVMGKVKTNKAAGKLINPLDSLGEKAKFEAKSRFVAMKLVSSDSSFEEEVLAMGAEQFLNTLLELYPKSEAEASSVDVSVSAVKLNIYPGNFSRISEQFFDLEKKFKAKVIPPDEEKTLVDVLVDNLKYAVSPGFQLRNFYKINVEKSGTDTFEKFKAKIFEIYIMIDDRISFDKNTLGLTVSIKGDDKSPEKNNGKRSGDNFSNNNSGLKKKQKPESDDKESRTACHACGRLGHKAGKKTCIFVHGNHPDRNKDFGPWERSEAGKKWKTAGFEELPPRKLLNGSNWDFDKAKKAFMDDPATIKGETEIHHIYNLSKKYNINHTLKTSLYLPDSEKVIAFILVDTGALQGNYIRHGIFEKLKEGRSVSSISSKYEVESFEKAKICTLTSCFECSRVANIYFNYKNTLNNKNESILIKAHILEDDILSYDLILGRQSILENNLLSKTPIQGSDYEVEKVSTVTTHINLLDKCCECCGTGISSSTSDILLVEKENLSVEELRLLPNLGEANNSVSLGRSNDISAHHLHNLYLMSSSSESEDSNPSTSPYKVLRVHKSALIDPVDDNDYIDYEENTPPWEEVLEENRKNNLNNTLDEVKTEVLYTFGDDATEEEKEIISRILNAYSAQISKKLNKNPASITPMRLDVDAEKWKVKANRLPARIFSMERNMEIRELVELLLEQGLIRPSSAAEVSQLVLIKKPDGSWRVCIDYRRLNLVTKSYSWPIPSIEQMFHRIGLKKPKYFAIMDFTSGFYQAPLHPDSWEYTAFATFMGNYEWTRLPMGAKGAPSYFQQKMATEVLYNLIHRINELYIDDLIVWGNTFKEFCENLKSVLQRLKEKNIIINPKKCKFLLTSVEYLGHLIDKDGIHFSRSKLDKMENIDLPETYAELKRFMGISVYFNRHIKNFTDKTRVLNKKLKNYNNLTVKQRKNKVFFNEEEVAAFENLKNAIKDCQKLFFLDTSKEIFLDTDASDYGIGGYLFQILEGIEYPIMFLSKALHNEQLNWSVPEKEAYAIYYCLIKMEHLLRDVFFTLRTDHENLTYINFGQSPKILRWKIQIQSYDFDIIHLKGKDNTIPDDFSRVVKDKRKEVKEANLLLFDEIIIPDDLYKIIELVHNHLVGHHGIDRTYQKLIDLGYNWRYMRLHISKFIKLCACCQKMSYLKPVIISHPFTIGVYEPMERLAVDTVGPFPEDEFGNCYIIVIICCFSRYCTLHATKDTSAISAARALLAHIANFGVPSQLLSDMGTQYVNDIIDQLLYLMGVEKLDTLPGIHEENSIAERRIKEVVEHLRDILFHKKVKSQWSDNLPLVQRICNAEWIEATGISPAKIIFGNSINLDKNIFLPNKPKLNENEPDSISTRKLSEWVGKMLDSQKHIIEIAQESQERLHLKYYNKKSNKIPTNFEIGSYVLINYGEDKPPSKLDQRYKGPYRVVNLDNKNKNRVTVQNLVTGKLEDFPNKQLKPFLYDEKYTSPEEVAMSDENFAIVESIVDHKPKNLSIKTPKRKISFKILYKFDKNPIWQDYKSLKDNEVLHEYLTKNKLVGLIPPKYKWGRDKK